MVRKMYECGYIIAAKVIVGYKNNWPGNLVAG
jgi:hypothetical protein